MYSMENAYLKEIERFFKLTPNHRLVSIFFGGGTPSLMPPELAGTLIRHAVSLWSTSDDLEITLEANPSTAEIKRFENFRHQGINRLSIGIQSFHEDALKFLGRKHSAQEGINAIHMAKGIFPRVSFDLIYARPHQTLKDWEDELGYALSFGTEHLSLYQLTIEPGTAFAPRYDRREFVLPEENMAADMFELTDALCSSQKLFRYETSNHAALGSESRHNMIYWEYEDYVGIGPGAHGRFTSGENKVATEQHRSPDIWLKKVEETKNGNIREHVVDRVMQAREALMMGLRLKEGVDLEKHDLSYEEAINSKALHMLLEEKLLTLENHRLKPTPQGCLCLNGVLKHLLS